MFTKALIAFLVLPGIVGGLLPVALGIFDPWRGAGLRLGYPIAAFGLVVLGWCIRDFYVSGKGTLAPWAPPENLVIVGLYRYTRNPMYLGVLLIVCGFALLFTSPLLTLYWAVLAVGFHLRVLFFEERWLAGQFGDEWIKYKRSVSRWVPGTRAFQHERSKGG